MLLEVRELVGHYGNIRVLHGIDLAVGAGTVVALLGPNGAGKSTLVKSLVGELPLLAGEGGTGENGHALVGVGGALAFRHSRRFIKRIGIADENSRS